tara:strand:+ start:361 stop:582 length:222 start_codon:yes stop_codon:yes gene_type:complete
MKIKVQDRNYTDPKIIMKTSFRGRCYSLRFENLNGEDVSGWGHLNKEQAKRMVKELEVFLYGKPKPLPIFTGD